MSEHHREIVQRLNVALERTREAYERTFKGHDLHPGTEIAGVWPFITAAYSGIEQTFKFQIAEASEKTVEELVAMPGSPYRHHNLGKLFRCLEAISRGQLSEQYRRFRTLHPYIDPVAADEFLDAVSAEDGRGYERWRYSLTAPERKIPTNSAEALLSIWDTAVQLCQSERERGHIRGVYEQLSEGLAWKLEQIVERFSMDRLERGLEPHDFRSESLEWVRAHGGPLNAFSELVHRAHRGQLPQPSADGVSASFAECLKHWLQARDGGSVKAQSDVLMFVRRAAGYRGRAQGVRWNRETNGFEDVPWELCETTVEAPPDGSFSLEDDFRGSRRLEKMRWVIQRGFRVTENYPARDDMPVDKWLCTLCGEKSVAPGEKVRICFWEHPDDEGGFYAEVAGSVNSKEGRLVRDVFCLDSSRGEGAYIVESPP